MSTALASARAESPAAAIRRAGTVLHGVGSGRCGGRPCVCSAWARRRSSPRCASPVGQCGEDKQREGDGGWHGSSFPRGAVAGFPGWVPDQVRDDEVDVMAPFRAPLCPAGHLPHGWGDQPSHRLSPNHMRRAMSADVEAANLPPCGGDVRQDRGGQLICAHLIIATPRFRSGC